MDSLRRKQLGRWRPLVNLQGQAPSSPSSPASPAAAALGVLGRPVPAVPAPAAPVAKALGAVVGRRSAFDASCFVVEMYF